MIGCAFIQFCLGWKLGFNNFDCTIWNFDWSSTTSFGFWFLGLCWYMHLFTFLAKCENNLQCIYDFILGYSTTFFFFLVQTTHQLRDGLGFKTKFWKCLNLAPMRIMLATSSLTHLLWNLLNSYHYLHRTWQIENANY